MLAGGHAAPAKGAGKGEELLGKGLGFRGWLKWFFAKFDQGVDQGRFCCGMMASCLNTTTFRKRVSGFLLAVEPVSRHKGLRLQTVVG